MNKLDILTDTIITEYNTNIILRKDKLDGCLVCELNPVLDGHKTCYLGYGKTYYKCILNAYEKLKSNDKKYKDISRMFFV